MVSEPTKRRQLTNRLKDKESRDAFVSARIRYELPAQIREMRMRRGWTQAELGAKADMRQSLICRFERKGYSEFTLNSLRRLASALDVALKVRFVPFSELVDDSDSPSRSSLDVASFVEDAGLGPPPADEVIGTYCKAFDREAATLATHSIFELRLWITPPLTPPQESTHVLQSDWQES